MLLREHFVRLRDYLFSLATDDGSVNESFVPRRIACLPQEGKVRCYEPALTIGGIDSAAGWLLGKDPLETVLAPIPSYEDSPSCSA